jgi:endonuclease G
MATIETTTFKPAFDVQHEAAEERVAERTEARQLRITTLKQHGGLAKADDPERVASRIDRLTHYYPDIRPVNPASIVAQDPDALAAAGTVLERVINTEDFVGVRYLETGFVASHAVGRIDIYDPSAHLIGYGTGSLVSPELLLTNHHVLPGADTARASRIEFNYEDGIDGRPLQPILFPLDPDRFFLTDEQLDFALVAVKAMPEELAPFGFNRLIEAEGKAIVGDFVTIVQHPGGEKKEVALRDNRIVDVLDLFLHYETDTKPGSSGSPVFSDQWEVCALHHASVPAPEHGELGAIVNEGIRVSRLLKFIGAQSFTGERRELVDRLFAEASAPPAGTPSVPSIRTPTAAVSGDVTVPLRITVTADRGDDRSTPLPQPPARTEGITIDPDYADRGGYESGFLGTGPLSVPLPTLSAELLTVAATNELATSEPSYVLPYYHYSAVMNKARRLAIFTVVNIDGALSKRLKREADHWSFDPRIPQDEQTGRDVYEHNDLDLGHLTRRLDPAWGGTAAAAKLANDDTFHFTNCTPQHKDFNRNKTSWAGLEDYILEHAENLKFKATVFNGPILASDDDDYRGVQLPRQFWKVAVMVKESGDLSATAYLLSQEELIKGLEIEPEAFRYDAYETYQVKVSRIEELMGLSFGSLRDRDPLAGQEATTAVRRINSLHDLVV